MATVRQAYRLKNASERYKHSGVDATVAYQVILEPGIGQFREFEPRRVHTRINSLVGTFSCGRIDLR